MGLITDDELDLILGRIKHELANKSAGIMKPIPQEWIKAYVDKMLVLAAKYDESSLMHAAVLQRADAIMDLVKAFRETELA